MVLFSRRGYTSCSAESHILPPLHENDNNRFTKYHFEGGPAVGLDAKRKPDNLNFQQPWCRDMWMGNAPHHAKKKYAPHCTPREATGGWVLFFFFWGGGPQKMASGRPLRFPLNPPPKESTWPRLFLFSGEKGSGPAPPPLLAGGVGAGGPQISRRKWASRNPPPPQFHF